MTPCSSPSATRSTPPSSSRSSGATSSPWRRTARHGRPWRSSTVRAATRSAPSSTRSCAIRRCTRGRGWSSLRSSTRQGSYGGSAAASTPRRGSGSAKAPVSGSSIRPTCPAGTTRAGSTRTRFRGRWAIANEALSKVTLEQRKGRKPPKVPNDPEAIVKGALAVLGNPTIRRETRAELLAFAARLPARARPAGRPRPTRCSSRTPVRQLLAVSPDLQTELRWPAAEHSRADLFRRAVADGRERPACDRARDADTRRAPASTGARSSPAGSASRSPSTAATRCGPQAFEEGIAAAAAASPSSRVLVSVFLDGGADALNMLYPASRPALPPAASAARAGTRGRHAVRRGLGASRGIRRSRRWLSSTREGKVNVMPAIGYDHPNQSHFTSRHFWEVGAADERLATGWLGRYVDRVGRADNPLQGLSLDWSLQPSLEHGAACRSLRSTRPTVRLLDARRLGRGRRPDDGAIDASARCRRHGDDGLGQAADAAQPVGAAVRAADARSVRRATQAVHEPGPVSRLGRLLPAPPRGAGGHDRRRGCRSAWSPLGRRRLRHPRRPGAGAVGHLDLTAASLLAFQRDLEARGLADRVLVHVWSEFGRRAKENGSGGTDHGAAGAGFLIGSRVNGRMVGECPGPRPARPRRQPPRHGRLPGPLRGAPRGLARHRRRGDHPGRAQVQAADDPPVRRALALGAIVAARVPLGAPAARRRIPRGCRSSQTSSRLTLSRGTIRHGDAVVELANFGEDDHDLALRRLGGTRTFRVGIVHPGRSASSTGSCTPAATRSGARSATTARAGCGRRSWFASYRSDDSGALRDDAVLAREREHEPAEEIVELVLVALAQRRLRRSPPSPPARRSSPPTARGRGRSPR